uniref:Lipoyl-binding domain-containing protein n=1 Tax=Schlesneria paludicola TaxID=360056 RepID=A0A7C2NUX7_9PLAN
MNGNRTVRRPIIVAPEDWGQEPVRLMHWLVDLGESVDVGDVLAEIGRPGIIGDVRATEAGHIAELSQAEGASILPGMVLGWIEPQSPSEDVP